MLKISRIKLLLILFPLMLVSGVSHSKFKEVKIFGLHNNQTDTHLKAILFALARIYSGDRKIEGYGDKHNITYTYITEKEASEKSDVRDMISKAATGSDVLLIWYGMGKQAFCPLDKAIYEFGPKVQPQNIDNGFLSKVIEGDLSEYEKKNKTSKTNQSFGGGTAAR